MSNRPVTCCDGFVRVDTGRPTTVGGQAGGAPSTVERRAVVSSCLHNFSLAKIVFKNSAKACVYNKKLIKN